MHSWAVFILFCRRGVGYVINKIRVNIVERKPLAIINLKEHLMIDGDAVILPNHHYINSVLITVVYSVLLDTV